MELIEIHAGYKCGIVPNHLPRMSICGITYRGKRESAQHGTISDVTCPVCLQIFRWIREEKVETIL